jgi:pimeloyl-ACP methyl ester carboxylesterase
MCSQSGNVGRVKLDELMEQEKNVNAVTIPFIDESTFHADVAYIENLWRRTPVGQLDIPIIDVGEGVPLVFVPILERLEFVYARQVRAFSQSRRVILYRRRETHTRPVGIAERAGELLSVLDSLGLECVDLIAHGDAAMVLLEFAIRNPQRCRSLIIIAQGADYQIAPHPLIWLIHEISMRLPLEYIFPAWFLRRIVINYIVAHQTTSNPDLTCRLQRNLIEEQFRKIALWPFVYKFSVLPIIHYFDIRERLDQLTMPILLINREDDVLSPEPKTRWLAEHLPNCAGYHVISGGERFFMYSQAYVVNQLIENFLSVSYNRI